MGPHEKKNRASAKERSTSEEEEKNGVGSSSGRQKRRGNIRKGNRNAEALPSTTPRTRGERRKKKKKAGAWKRVWGGGGCAHPQRPGTGFGREIPEGGRAHAGLKNGRKSRWHIETQQARTKKLAGIGQGRGGAEVWVNRKIEKIRRGAIKQKHRKKSVNKDGLMCIRGNSDGACERERNRSR